MPILAVFMVSVGAQSLSESPCYLTLKEHRSDQLLAQWKMPDGPVRFSVEFIHSVLNTPVQDIYEMRAHHGQWRAHLVQEVFQGQGYGLPYAATDSSETMIRDGETWRLTLDRVIDPFIQLPLPSQEITLVWGDSRVRLGDLSDRSVRITLQGCPTPEAASN